MIWSLKLKTNFKQFLSNKTLNSLILTYKLISDQQGSEHREASSRWAHACFSLLFGQGMGRFPSTSHHMQAGLLPWRFLEKAAEATPPDPISSIHSVTGKNSADPPLPQAPPHCPGPMALSQTYPLSTGITPHQGCRSLALTSFCSQFRLAMQVFQGFECLQFLWSCKFTL